MVYISRNEESVSTRAQATQCLISGLEKVAETWKAEGRGAIPEIQPEECATFRKERGHDSVHGGRRGANGHTEEGCWS